MRKGNRPAFLLDPKGRVIAFGTGSDATSEHENGSAEMQRALTGTSAMTSKEAAAYLRKKAGIPPEQVLTRAQVESLLEGVPDLLARKRITSNPEAIVFQERQVNGEPEAAITFHADGYSLDPFNDRELSYSTFSEPKDLAGAWDSRSFGLRTRGEKNVARLRAFATSLRAGKGIFAGTFLEESSRERLYGVIIAIEELLRPEHRAAIKVAQEEYVSKVALELMSRTQELIVARRASKKIHPDLAYAFFWPIWREGKMFDDVAYRINLRVGSTLRGGPYSFEEMLALFETRA